MAALRRMDAPSYGGDWQAEPYGYPAGYGGGQTLPPPASGGGGSMGGGGGTLGRSKGKMMTGGGPGGPNPKGQSKGGPKVNGNNSGGQGGWWPECTCTNREWYDQVSHHPYLDTRLRPLGLAEGRGREGRGVRGWRSNGRFMYWTRYGTSTCLEGPNSEACWWMVEASYIHPKPSVSGCHLLTLVVDKWTGQNRTDLV